MRQGGVQAIQFVTGWLIQASFTSGQLSSCAMGLANSDCVSGVIQLHVRMYMYSVSG